MTKQYFYSKFIFANVCAGFIFAASIVGQTGLIKSTQKLALGETEISINIYEKKGGANITFFAPHRNEQIGLRIAKEIIAKRGGRLIEIESLGDRGNPARELKFSFQGKSYSIDPNRIYTDNGLRCEISPLASETVKKFAAALLNIVLAPGGNRLRNGEKLLVAVHNNSDVDRHRTASAKAQDLTASAFSRFGKFSGASSGDFQEQAEGVYLSNVEADEDNFFFITTPKFLSFFAEKGFNAVVQKPATKLQSTNCNIDDGSFSVFAAKQNFPYINVEADATTGAVRQLQMLEAVYELLQKMSESESKFTVVSGTNENTGAIE